MSRKLKVLGLVLFASLALGALGAAGARAEGEGVFTSEKAGKARIKGTSSNDVFTLGGTIFTCATTDFESELTEFPSTSLTLNVEYTQDCEALSRTVTVTTNGCAYVIHNATTMVDSEGTENDYTATVDIECPKGKVIETHIYSTKVTEKPEGLTLCTVTIPAQNNLEKVTITNMPNTPPTKPDITISGELTNIKYTIHRNSILCPKSTQKETEEVFTDFSYKFGGAAGTPMTLQGFLESGNPADISMSDGTPAP